VPHFEREENVAVGRDLAFDDAVKALKEQFVAILFEPIRTKLSALIEQLKIVEQSTVHQLSHPRRKCKSFFPNISRSINEYSLPRG